jgi:hypothetical protein
MTAWPAHRGRGWLSPGTLDGALGEPVPVGWDDVDYVLKATGRAELTDGDRAGLGVLAARFPLLG